MSKLHPGTLGAPDPATGDTGEMPVVDPLNGPTISTNSDRAAAVVGALVDDETDAAMDGDVIASVQEAFGGAFDDTLDGPTLNGVRVVSEILGQADVLLALRNRETAELSDLTEAVGGVIPSDQFATLSGLDIAKLRTTSLLKNSEGHFAFQARGGQLLYGIEEVVYALKNAGADLLLSLRFFASRPTVLSGFSPIQHLKGAHDFQVRMGIKDSDVAHQVAALARAYVLDARQG